ncbi:MAG: serine/threonine protein kinase [Gammaproteobacteria bacterium]|nr:MAG: serine/threonine protein kinase [Gammaproteobacteria bacterium]
MDKDTRQHPYDALTPELILDAIEQFGVRCDGGLTALNSYENRVYQVGIEDDRPLIAKFYRPARWSNDAIREEHQFTLALKEAEIPVVAPLPDAKGNTLFEHEGFRVALFPRQGGRWPDLDDMDNLEQMGRYLGRLHNVGSAAPFNHRRELTLLNYGHDSCQFLIETGFIPHELTDYYQKTAQDLLRHIEAAFGRAGSYPTIRLHGDCHLGNILWTEQGPHIVDFDDCLMGPAVQDLWMLLSGSRQDIFAQLDAILEGYAMFREFNPAEFHLIEGLRSLRMMHYAAWLARRWDDPAFPRAFPWFNTHKYWEEHIMSLKDQIDAVDAPPPVYG